MRVIIGFMVKKIYDYWYIGCFTSCKRTKFLIKHASIEIYMLSKSGFTVEQVDVQNITNLSLITSLLHTCI